MAKKYDLLIIGAGPGGYTAALKAASFGMKVGVIEQKKPGGTCINHGCIPAKALLHASSIFHMLQNSDEFGVSADFVSFDFKKMQQYKRNAVQTCREEIEELFRKNHVDYISGKASIRRNKTVEVTGAEGREFYEADHIIIASGAVPAKLPVPGAELPGVLDSDQLMNAENWNFDRLIIIGGGVIGVEFATIFNSLCSNVTIIEKGEQLLGPMDGEISRHLEEELRKKGIQIYCGASVKEIRQEGPGENGLSVVMEKEGEEKVLRAGRIVTAIGRRPFLDGLWKEDVSFEMENGHLAVSSEFETSQPGIYAIGDVTDGIQLAHLAAAQGTYVVEKIAGVNHSIKLQVVPNGMFVSLPVVPSCIYTNPEIASVGITEEEARKMNMKVRCGWHSMTENGKSIISGTECGFIRLIFEAYSNTIVGAQMVCPRATDMIAEMATAIANGLTAQQLSVAMRAHPTYSEGIAAAIQDAMKEGH